MRIVIISDWFSEKMGYAENCLPKAMAALGREVHLVTSNAQVYFDSPSYKETYESFLGPGVVPCEVKELDGYILHRLPYMKWKGRLRIKGLIRKLFALRPQIVQTFDVFCMTTYEATLTKPLLGYKLFHESHIHASVFPPATHWMGPRWRFSWLVYAATVGRFISILSEKCYPISSDAADIVIQFLGFQGFKTKVCSLGVDTDLFSPASDASAQEARLRLRQQLGFSPDDIVCIYTGRFSSAKGPLVLAQAIGNLKRQGQPFRGLFIGNGTEAEIGAIQACPGCVAHPFVPFRELPQFYRAADIGVWPKQESTSQLDAAACGLPIIVSNRVKVRERVDGNGLVYEEDDPDDLARQILALSDSSVRHRMSEYGVGKIRERFSWERIARERVQDYEAALRCNR